MAPKTLVALLLLAAAPAAAADLTADQLADAAASDDVCQGSEEQCSLELRQLRGERRTAALRPEDVGLAQGKAGGAGEARARAGGSAGRCTGAFRGTPVHSFEKAPWDVDYATALKSLDLDAVKADVEELLTDSQECWPADFGNYGPFFVRLAWHCSGTFRMTDGVGGCAGGRQRFDVEASWPDNVNLDKARALLVPIKEKYGEGLSWGDLFVLAGTQSLRSMGVPIKSFCAGRIDDSSGAKSLPLGPSKIQEKVAPCTSPENGLCQKNPLETALAPTVIGDIYVDPQGPMGVPDPKGSAKEIRIVFGKMGHDDRATVALTGGGHAFGKVHGACNVPDAQGLPPNEAYKQTPREYPYQGKCGTGVGNDTFSSGFEGPWTSTPTKWSNEYFKYLLQEEWETHTGPGGKIQWRMAKNPNDKRMRLTADMAMIADPEYKKYVIEFANNMSALDEAFDLAWTGLTTKGGRWSENKFCDGPMPPVSLFTPMENMMLAGDHTPSSA